MACWLPASPTSPLQHMNRPPCFYPLGHNAIVSVAETSLPDASALHWVVVHMLKAVPAIDDIKARAARLVGAM